MKTRIKEVDGLYYPEYRNWGLWCSIEIKRNNLSPVYYSNSLNTAKKSIDKHLAKNKNPIIRIIEYPKSEE